jgi:hypothetical protein
MASATVLPSNPSTARTSDNISKQAGNAPPVIGKRRLVTQRKTRQNYLLSRATAARGGPGRCNLGSLCKFICCPRQTEYITPRRWTKNTLCKLTSRYARIRCAIRYSQWTTFVVGTQSALQAWLHCTIVLYTRTRFIFSQTISAAQTLLHVALVKIIYIYVYYSCLLSLSHTPLIKHVYPTGSGPSPKARTLLSARAHSALAQRSTAR